VPGWGWSPGAGLASSQPWVQWSWVHRHPGLIYHALREHVVLTALAVGIGLLIAMPLALLAYEWRRLETPVLGLTGAIYTVPSLALFALLIPVTGLSRTTSEIGLVGYTLLILIRNILAGLAGVPPEVRDAATGMGFTRRRLLVRVELPLALPAIVAGIRIATVTTIGLVTVTALIGQGGLGQLINEGLISDFRTKVVVGAVLSVVLAATVDAALVGAERLATPWSRRRVG
jgi:osmoprotectant transport system permease protein